MSLGIAQGDGLVSVLIVFIAITLIISAIGKLTSRNALAPYLAEFGLSGRAVRLLTPGISLVELLLGVLLLVGVALRWVIGAALIVTILFVLTHIAALLRGAEEPCRCFGVVDTSMQPSLSLTRAAFLAAATGGAAIWLWASSATAVHVDLETLLTGALAACTYVLAFPLLGETAKTFARAREWRAGIQQLRESNPPTG